ncbi:MAG TPA: hypothetical protein VKV17_02555 [Bryobacteraceae bacterium]|nr:hypothetical protein [Bryobacteraceae bacterium]
MVGLTPNDSTLLSFLTGHPRLSDQERDRLLKRLETPDVRAVGEALLDPQKYSKASAEIRAAVDRFKKWMEREQRLLRSREGRRRTRPH